MKKSLIIFLISILPLITISTPANANMFNKLRKGFYFEKYKTADEAKAALLEVHPVGSDIDGLVETLKNAGARCFITDGKMNEIPTGKNSFIASFNKKEKITGPSDHFSCDYKIKVLGGFLGSYDWGVILIMIQEI